MSPTDNFLSNPWCGLGQNNQGHGSQFAQQQLQRQIDIQALSNNANFSFKNRKHPCKGISRSSNRRFSANGPARTRVSRACDRCHHLRTRCDGQNPCVHCVEYNLTCEYIREQKKRGKVSRKELAWREVEAAAVAYNEQKPLTPEPSDGSLLLLLQPKDESFSCPSVYSDLGGLESGSSSPNAEGQLQEPLNGTEQKVSKASESPGNLTGVPAQHQPLPTSQQDNTLDQEQFYSPPDTWMTNFQPIQNYRLSINSHPPNSEQLVYYKTYSYLPEYGDLPQSLQDYPNNPVTLQYSGTVGAGYGDLLEFPVHLRSAYSKLDITALTSSTILQSESS